MSEDQVTVVSVTQRRAIRVLRNADPRYDGWGVVTIGATGLLDRQAWVNRQTAEALERRGLVEIRGHGEEREVRLRAAAAAY